MPNSAAGAQSSGGGAHSTAEPCPWQAEQKTELPVWTVRERLLEEVRRHPTLVLVGETGSGKTTLIPQLLLDAGLAGKQRMIGCTQPRRVAATSVARRVARERSCQVGQEVGYSIRFEDKTSPATRIKYMTDGMLLREALLDPLLRRYAIIIVDEAHERTVQTDVLLGLLRGVQVKRPKDFRLLVMSATLNAAAYVKYFPGARAAYIEGRQHPVDVYYTAQPAESYLDAALAAVLQVHLDEPPGDVLVFLTGQDEIHSLHRLLLERATELPSSSSTLQLLPVPIFASLPAEQQMKVFETTPEGHRKVVLATNIAETSITVPGVRYVIDTGFVKSRGYSARLGADSLQVVPISQAQARQRSGRAGRVAAGKAFRLYTEASFQQLPAVSVPEILRSDLAAVALQLKALGIKNVQEFQFLDPPPAAALVRALELLHSLGALDSGGELTPRGRAMARLPLHPTHSRVLLAAAETGCALDALAIVAMLSSDEDIFVTPRGKREAATAARQQFVSSEGDHLTLLNVFRAVTALQPQERPDWCRDRLLNLRALRAALRVHKQLREALEGLGLALASGGEDTTPVRRALVAGLFVHAARRQADGSYRVMATGQAVALHPASVLCGRKPDCVVFNELVLTTRHYARHIAAVDPRWLPELVPAFFARAGRAVADGTG